MPQRWDAQGKPVTDAAPAQQRWDASGNPVSTPTANLSESAAPGHWQAPQSWGDVSLANPFRGGLGEMAHRSADYAAGAAGGAGSALWGLGEGITKMGSDLYHGMTTRAPGVPGPSGDWQPFNEDVLGAAKGIRDTITAPAHWLTYKDPSQFGNEVFNLALLLNSPKKIADTPGDVRAGLEAIKPKDQLLAHASKRVMEGQLELQQHLKAGEGAYAAQIDGKTSAIRAADQANPVPLDPKPVKDTFVQAMAKHSADSRLNLPAVNAAQDLLDKMPDKMNWERLKQLRTDLGNRLDHTSSPMERDIIGQARATATDMLAKRADDLGMTKDFKAYNKEYSALANLREGTLSKLKTVNPIPSDYFKQFDPRNVVINNMLDKFDEASAGQPVGHGQAIRDIVKGLKPMNDVLNQGEGASLMGRFRAVMRHPAYGLVGGVLGMLPGELLPGGRFLGGMVGASAGSALADRITLAQELVRGPRFPEGAAELKAGTGEMLPSQVKASMAARGPRIAGLLGPAPTELGPIPAESTARGVPAVAERGTTAERVGRLLPQRTAIESKLGEPGGPSYVKGLGSDLADKVQGMSSSEIDYLRSILDRAEPAKAGEKIGSAGTKATKIESAKINNPDWEAGERTHEINRLKEVLRNRAATAEERSIAESQLKNYMEGK